MYNRLHVLQTFSWFFLFTALLSIHFTWNLHIISLSFLSVREQTVQTNIIMQLKRTFSLKPGCIPTQCYPPTAAVPDILWFGKSIQISANKGRCTARKCDILLTLNNTKTRTLLKHSYRWNHFWVNQQYFWACGDCNIPTSNAVTSSLLDLFPPSQQVNCPQTMSLSSASGSTE